MKALKNTGLALTMSSMLCVAASAEEMTLRVDLFRSTAFETAQFGRPSQRVYLPAFPCALGELTRVRLEFACVVRSELRVHNGTNTAVAVDATVSESIQLSRLSQSGSPLLDVSQQGAWITGSVGAGQQQRLQHGFVQASNYSFDTNLED